MREQVERLLTEMGWESDGYMWSSPTRDSTGLTPVTVASDPGMDWIFDHAIPWATAQGWTVQTHRAQYAETDTQYANVTVYYDVWNGPVFQPVGALFEWKPGEPDLTCAAIIDALYQAVTG